MSTIVALSTPIGRGAIAVVRLSGPESLSITRQLAPELHDVKPRRASITKIYSEGGEVLDECLVTFFPAPNSVTGEDVVEIGCHGSPAVIRQILDRSLALGSVLAGPGEFTLRSLANGKINLSQAEAVRDLISAQTDVAVKQAARQMGGELSYRLEHYKRKLIEVIVVLESALEFVEDDLPQTKYQEIQESILFVGDGVGRLRDSYPAGRLIHDGARVAIVGPPNVGKSSLFNKLIQQDRAIVTAIPGTTRDTLDHPIDIGGVPVVLTDTAGLRETTDSIESLGIERTLRTASDADLVLNIVDGSTENGLAQAGVSECPSLLVLNKSDLFSSENSGDGPIGIRVSALTGEGLDDLRAAIIKSLTRDDGHYEGLLITNARHHDLLRASSRELEAAMDSIAARASEELILAPLHNVLRLLGEITGETTTEDILTQIFSTFCIGK
ncbi:MAG: tRNA uridine-5-carboxymethylaminomethyl(34) synthesis GTPase MnmE [Acidobacteria bacterium]|nr:MAG: tRNA uridine-5-carboxymethylaminomethyl(34) synthesis GTPase MnmE [Acidobacteriota bacterium]